MTEPTEFEALGLIGFTDQGTYSSTKNYVKNDIVHDGNNSMWLCLDDDVKGVTPSKTSDKWRLWIDSQGGVKKLAELDDVSIASPTASSVLQYDSASKKFKNGKKLDVDIVKQDSKYGYVNDAGTFTPFKSQADIDSAVSDAKVGTATAPNVLEGYTFTNKNSSGLTGTMKNNGAVNPSALAAGSSYTIPQGYHNGKGKVTAQANAGTYTFPTNDTGSTKDMGASNNYRYVNAENVYKKGKEDCEINLFAWYDKAGMVTLTSPANCWHTVVTHKCALTNMSEGVSNYTAKKLNDDWYWSRYYMKKGATVTYNMAGQFVGSRTLA